MSVSHLFDVVQFLIQAKPLVLDILLANQSVCFIQLFWANIARYNLVTHRPDACSLFLSR